MQIGYVDAVEGTVVKGWAFDTDSGEAPFLECVVCEKVVATVRPHEFRSDLSKIAGTGHCAFTVHVPISEYSALAQIRFADTKVVVPNGELIRLEERTASLCRAPLSISFIPTRDFLCCISPVLVVAGRRTFGLTLEILDNGVPVRCSELSAADMHDGLRHDMLFEPIANSANRPLVARFSCNGPMGAEDLQSVRVRLQNGETSDDFDIALQYSPRISPTAFPERACLSPVTQCNLNCIHCISAWSRPRATRFSKQVLDSLVEAKTNGFLTEIGSDFSGDIFFYESKYGGFLDFLESHDFCLTHIDTHANDINQDLAIRLLRRGLRYIYFSLDAGSRKTYERIRYGGSWEKALAGISTFQRAYQHWQDGEGARSPPVWRCLTMVVWRSNIHECTTVIDLAKQLGLDGVLIRQGEVFSRDMEADALQYDMDYANYWFDRALRYAADREINLNIPDRYAGTARRFCNAPWDGPIITGQGDVLACCEPNMKMGNLNANTLDQIWNGEVYRLLRETANTDGAAPHCRNCPRVRSVRSERSPLMNGAAFQESFEEWAARQLSANTTKHPAPRSDASGE